MQENNNAFYAEVQQVGSTLAKLGKDLAEKLLEPFPDKAIYWSVNATTSTGKANISPYTTSHYLISRMNSLLGVLGWSFEVAETSVKTNSMGIPIYAHAVGCVKIGHIVRCDVGTSTASFDVCPASGTLKKGFGDNAKNVDCIPHELHVTKQASAKDAVSDAMKRAFRQFGVGLYFWFYPKDVYVPLKDKRYRIPDVPQNEYERLRKIGEALKKSVLGD